MFTIPIDIAPLLQLNSFEAELLLDFANSNHLSIPEAMRTLLLLGLTDPVHTTGDDCPFDADPPAKFELPAKFFPATPVVSPTAPEGAGHSKVIGP